MSDVFGPLLAKVAEEFENLGLYPAGFPSIQVNHMTEDVAKKFAEGEISVKEALAGGVSEFCIVGEFRIGKVAWTSRVLDPETHEISKEAERIFSTDDEDARAAAARAILEGLKEEREE